LGNSIGLNQLQSQSCSAAKKFAEVNLTAGLSDYQKVKIIHDFIVKNGNLDTVNDNVAYSETVAYGVLVGNIAVSDGYADAFRLLAGIAGIDNRIIVGAAGTQRRVWNLVKLNDGWYHIDITADDRADMTDGTLNYDYFLISDTRIEFTHSWNKADCLNAPNDYIYTEK
jgi:transglutaminase/protease-like cytokinesis protein 3